MKVKEEIKGNVPKDVSGRTLHVVNRLNNSKKTITAETQPGEVKRIEWSGNPSAPNKESFSLAPGEILKVRIEDGADNDSNEFVYVEFPGWAEFDFKGSNKSLEGIPNPRIKMNRSAEGTRIWIEKGKVNFTLELWYYDQMGAFPRPGEENVNIGDDQT
jgi:hypothetical protein